MSLLSGAAVLALATGIAAGAKPRDATVSGPAMGGLARVVVRCPADQAHARCMAQGMGALRQVQALEALATDWSPSGEIARLNAAAGQGAVPLSPPVAQMLRASVQVARATDGAFDPTVNALWGLWDFQAGVVPEARELQVARAQVDWRRLELDGAQVRLPQAGMSVTLGGVAQGYAAAQALAGIDAAQALVDVSGDLAARGAWTVGLRDPSGDRTQSLATLTLVDACLSTSGVYEQGFWRDGAWLHHILDPRTGWPAGGAISATVVHPDGAVADALATALVVTGPDPQAVEALGAWALLLTPQGQLVELGARGPHIQDLVLSW